MGSQADPSKTPTPLPTPATPAGRDGLDAILARPGRAVLAFDFDGTLAPIVPDPEQARAHPDAVPALAALAPKVASVAVVTGRPADVAVRHGGFAGRPRPGTPRRPRPLRRRTLGRASPAPSRRPRPAPRRRRRPRRTARLPRPLRRLAGHLDRGEGPGRRRPHPPRRGPAGRLRGPARTPRRTRHPPRPDRRTGPHGPGTPPAGHGQGRRAPRVRTRDRRRVRWLYAGDDLGDLPAFAAVEKLRSERRARPAGVQRQQRGDGAGRSGRTWWWTARRASYAC